MDWHRIKEIGGDIFIVAFGFWMLSIFIEILMKGSHFVGEPNILMLTFELILTACIIILGLDRFFNDLKKKGES